jgi:hypothetical protein
LKKCGGKKLNQSILVLMNLTCKNTIFPLEFNDCKIKPILKDFGKSNKDINNIRPISISNSLAKFFERLMLNKNYKNLATNKNQFGFKRNSSCKLALFCIRETIIKYMENNSTCYLISLDAEKPFDKLWRPGLFYKLIKRLSNQDKLLELLELLDDLHAYPYSLKLIKVEKKTDVDCDSMYVLPISIYRKM